jgi:hypothetical protein
MQNSSIGPKEILNTTHVARIGEKRNTCRLFVGKPAEKRQLERPRRIWDDSIQVDLTEIRWGGTDWIQVLQDRDQWRVLVNTAMNLRVL